MKAEKGIFTPKQISTLLAAAPDEEWRALIALGYFTGGRLIDLARLTWGSVERQKQTLCFKQKKTGGIVLIPDSPQAVALLKKAAPRCWSGPLFCAGSQKRAGLAKAVCR